MKIGKTKKVHKNVPAPIPIYIPKPQPIPIEIPQKVGVKANGIP